MIGILPAAGHATRMMGLPKMLLPIPPNDTLIDRMRRQMERTIPRRIVIGSNGVTRALLESLEQHPVTTVYNAYTATMSETVLLAQRFAEAQERVLFGMPDTYIEDAGVWDKLNAALNDGADVAVGLFQTTPEMRHKRGMCRVDENAAVVEVVDKPHEADLFWAWGALAWKPVFWGCINPMHPHVGYAVQRAIDERLDVRGVPICYTARGFWDAGTPDEYFEMIRYLGTG